MLTRREWLAASGSLSLRWLRAASGLRAGLSVEARARDRALRGGWRDRHARAPARDAHRSGTEAERRDRQSRRRREPGRHPGGRDRAARRLHDRHDRQRLHDQSRPVRRQAALRHAQGFRADLADRDHAAGVRGASFGAGEQRAGAGRARQAEAGHDLCAARARHADASRRRAVAPGDRHRGGRRCRIAAPGRRLRISSPARCR